MNSNPLGIFDSGIGGLTVAREIIQTLPQENIMYLGDTARVPYGTRGPEIITKFALELTSYMLRQDVKALVIACNTISATCLEEIQQLSPVPVINVITPTVEQAVTQTKTGKIGVIGTHATIASRAYEKEIRQINKDIQVFTQACPLFVPLVEEGMTDNQAAKLIAQEYLAPLQTHNIDTLILGCTHYHLLQQTIQEIMGENIKIIDSAGPTAEALRELLQEKDLINNQEAAPVYKFLVTDSPEQKNKAAGIFFGNTFPGKLEKITL